MKQGLLKGMLGGGSIGELQVLLGRDVGSSKELGGSGMAPNASAHSTGVLGGGSGSGKGHAGSQSHSHSHSGAAGGNQAPMRNGASPRIRNVQDVVSPSASSFSPAVASLSMAATYNPLAPGPAPTGLLAVSSAMLYGTVGLAMGFINKAVLQQWPFSNSLLMFQMAASVGIVYIASLLNLVETRPLTVRTALSLWGVVFFYNANVAFALAAVQALSIPVYHVLKRLTPVMILLCKVALGEPAPPLQITLSVCTVVAGCFLSGAGDLSFDPHGYLFAIVSCALQSAYLIFVERSGSDKGFSSSELMVYNAVLSLPVLMLLTLGTGEALHSIPALLELVLDPFSSFAWVFVISLVAGVLLNYSLFLCTLNNTALTTTIVGALRSVLGTILGFFLLGGVKATPELIAGCAINTMGGIWYTIAKMRQKMLSASGGSTKPSVQEQSRGQGEEGVPLKSNAGP